MPNLPTIAPNLEVRTAEVARYARVSERTVQRYADRGVLPCRVLPSGGRRFRWADVVALFGDLTS